MEQKPNRRRRGGHTIFDVAERAGVSPMTVSRVINGEKNVREATRERVTKAMAGRGRVLLRKSGTEPLVRVMVEGEDETQVRGYAEELAKLVTEVSA